MRKQLPWRFKGTIDYKLKTDSLGSYYRRILQDNMFVATIYGIPNSGKSGTALELMRQICPTFSLERDVCFTLEDFFKKFRQGTAIPYRVILLDDFGSELDPKYSMFDEARNFAHVGQVGRTFNTGLFITTTNKNNINKDTRERVADYYIEIKERRAKYVEAAVHYLQKNNWLDKTYRHCLHIAQDGVINNKGVGEKCEIWKIQKPPEWLYEAYRPLRVSKGWDIVEKAERVYGKDKIKKEDEADIAKKIALNLDKYIVTSAKGKKRLNSALISYDYGLGSKRLVRVIALLKPELDNAI